MFSLNGIMLLYFLFLLFHNSANFLTSAIDHFGSTKKDDSLRKRFEATIGHIVAFFFSFATLFTLAPHIPSTFFFWLLLERLIFASIALMMFYWRASETIHGHEYIFGILVLAMVVPTAALLANLQHSEYTHLDGGDAWGDASELFVIVAILLTGILSFVSLSSMYTIANPNNKIDTKSSGAQYWRFALQAAHAGMYLFFTVLASFADDYRQSLLLTTVIAVSVLLVVLFIISVSVNQCSASASDRSNQKEEYCGTPVASILSLSVVGAALIATHLTDEYPDRLMGIQIGADVVLGVHLIILLVSFGVESATYSRVQHIERAGEALVTLLLSLRALILFFDADVVPDEWPPKLFLVGCIIVSTIALVVAVAYLCKGDETHIGAKYGNFLPFVSLALLWHTLVHHVEQHPEVLEIVS